MADIRNSKVVDLIHELEDYSMTIDVIDPHASPEEVKKEFGIEMIKQASSDYDCIVLAVGHSAFKKLSLDSFARNTANKLLVFDVKGALDNHDNIEYLKL